MPIIERLNPSKSEPGKPPYVTKLNTDTGVAWCTCRGWVYNKQSPKRCTHTDQLLTAAPTPEPTTSTSTPPPTEEPLRPMLASAMTKGLTLSAFPASAWMGEVKYDGFRVTVRKAGARLSAHSRPQAGKAANARELPATIAAAFATLPDGLYDGELLIPGTTTGRSDYTAFVVFDVLELLGQSTLKLAYDARRQLLELAVAHYDRVRDPDARPVLTASHVFTPTQEAIDALFAEGQEGAILKRRTSPYRPGYRSPDWVKVKRSGAETVTITGFERGKAASSTPYSVTLFRRDNGMEGKCGTRDTATINLIARNPDGFIGRRLVVSYVELQPSGAFRSPIFDHLAGEGE
jgi:ATP-dependent DNA ligase